MERTDVIPVMIEHLEQMAVALDHAKNFSMAHDLAEGFRAVRGAPRPSRLTAMLEAQHGRVVGYLNTEPPEEGNSVNG
jgi:hypothetical protein